ncbi:MAG: hypothetical protein EXS49_01080 [Candidatus Pacebacteria bacterium]|nr:hypothetical protein [Candidatus Paceibacterota bacterium]
MTTALTTSRFVRSGFEFRVAPDTEVNTWDLVPNAPNRDGKVTATSFPDSIASISEAFLATGDGQSFSASLEEAMSLLEFHPEVLEGHILIVTGTQVMRGGARNMEVFAIRKHERADNTGFVVTTIPLTAAWARHYKMAQLTAT